MEQDAYCKKGEKTTNTGRIAAEITVTPPMVNEYGNLNPIAYQQMMIFLFEQFMTANNVEVPNLIKEYNVSWVLLAMSVEIKDSIMPGERLEAEIWNTDRKGVVFRRDVEIRHTDGTIAAFGAQFYSVLDLTTRHICKNEKIIKSLEMGEGKSCLEASSRSEYNPNQYTYRHLRKAHPSWIDELGHTNNIRYGEISYDAISESYRKRFSDLARMEIYFIHELQLDEQVKICTMEGGNNAEVIGLSLDNEQIYFHTKYQFRDRNSK